MRLDVGPPFVRLNAGWLALDFVNTVSGWLPQPDGGKRDWADRVATERLAHYGDFVDWSRLSGTVDDSTAARLAKTAGLEPRRARSVLARGRALRSALYRLFRGRIAGWDPLPQDLDTVNRELHHLSRGEVLVPTGGGFDIAWTSARVDLQALLWPPLKSAVALLSSPERLARVGRCAGEGCGWLYLDIGRGRPRLWCDARDCGNVAKVRAYRSRHSGRRNGV